MERRGGDEDGAPPSEPPGNSPAQPGPSRSAPRSFSAASAARSFSGLTSASAASAALRTETITTRQYAPRLPQGALSTSVHRAALIHQAHSGTSAARLPEGAPCAAVQHGFLVQHGPSGTAGLTTPSMAPFQARSTPRKNPHLKALIPDRYTITEVCKASQKKKERSFDCEPQDRSEDTTPALLGPPTPTAKDFGLGLPAWNADNSGHMACTGRQAGTHLQALFQHPGFECNSSRWSPVGCAPSLLAPAEFLPKFTSTLLVANSPPENQDKIKTRGGPAPLHAPTLTDCRRLGCHTVLSPQDRQKQDDPLETTWEHNVELGIGPLMPPIDYGHW